MIVLIDDIPVYSRNLEEHGRHLSMVLQTLRNHELYTKFSKCEFWLTRVAFLGHVISGEGISVNSTKIKAVISWPRSTTVTEIRNFLGLARYDRRFVKGFSALASPLTQFAEEGREICVDG